MNLCRKVSSGLFKSSAVYKVHPRKDLDSTLGMIFSFYWQIMYLHICHCFMYRSRNCNALLVTTWINCLQTKAFSFRLVLRHIMSCYVVYVCVQFYRADKVKYATVVNLFFLIHFRFYKIMPRWVMK